MAGSLGPYCTRPPFTLCPVAEAPHRPHSSHIRRDALATPSSYQHDALGNRIKEAWTDARGAIDYSYLPGNHLIQRGSTGYSWGSYGQLILKDDQPNALGGETNYDYNACRLMAQVRVNGSPVAQFFYDPYGRRVKIVEGDTITITLYSGNDIVYEVKTKPGQLKVTTRYLAINGKYLAKVVQEGTNPPQTYFYHTDLVGSVRAITDSQGQVVARFEYEPFGVTVQASGPLAGDEVHKFTGKPEDAAVGLYYYYARYYSPEAGRFLSRDPIDGSYVYVHNAPLILVDPLGLQAKAEWQAFVNKQLADIRELLVANQVTFIVFEQSSLIKSLLDPPVIAKVPWEIASTGSGVAEGVEEATRLLVKLGVPQRAAGVAAAAVTAAKPGERLLDLAAETVTDRWDPTESCLYRIIHISRQEQEGIISDEVTDMFGRLLGDRQTIDGVRHYTGTVYDLTNGQPSLVLYIAALREPTNPSWWSRVLGRLGATDGFKRRTMLRLE
ncbi:MAG: RHS repeat domain-containing protein [Bacteroidota bacterium]